MPERNTEVLLISIQPVTYEYKGAWGLEMGELLMKSCMQLFSTRFFLKYLSLTILEFRDDCEHLRCSPGVDASSVNWLTLYLDKWKARTGTTHAFQSVF